MMLFITFVCSTLVWPSSGHLPDTMSLKMVQAKTMTRTDATPTHAGIASNRELGTESTIHVSPMLTSTEGIPLVLIYAVLDNNLSEQWETLINNAEAGVHAGINVYMLIDGPDSDDTYIYNLQADNNDGTELSCPSLEDKTCGERYTKDENYWSHYTDNTATSKRITDDTATPQSIFSFFKFAWEKHREKYQEPSTVLLSLVGHGSGWNASVLPAQPSHYVGQPTSEGDDRGGVLWDDHTDTTEKGTRSLSTHALGVALQNIKETYGKIDLLYLDACSMGMAEVAYELRNSAKYLLASPNIAWATFPYDQLLAEVAPEVDGKTIGLRWLDVETKLLIDDPQTITPFVLSLIDLSQMDTLATFTHGLAEALQTLVSSVEGRQHIGEAYIKTDHYVANSDVHLDENDGYSDLDDFATQLMLTVTDPQVISAAQAVKTAIASAVVSVTYQSGTPLLPNHTPWIWEKPSGLGIYLPLGKDEARRGGYTAKHVAWVDATQWDDFLISYLGPPSGIPEICQTTSSCDDLPSQLLLPGLQLLEGPTLSLKPLVIGKELTVNIRLINNSPEPLDLKQLTFSTRGPSCTSRTCDKKRPVFNDTNFILKAGEIYPRTASIILQETGPYFGFLHYTDRAGNWKTLGGDIVFTIADGIEFTEPLRLSNDQPQPNEVFTFMAEMTNRSDQPVKLVPLLIAGRGPNCDNWICEDNLEKYVDLGLSDRILQPGEVYKVSKEWFLVEPGPYFFQFTTKNPDGKWVHFGNKLEFEIRVSCDDPGSDPVACGEPTSQIYLPLVHR